MFNDLNGDCYAMLECQKGQYPITSSENYRKTFRQIYIKFVCIHNC